MSRTFEDGASPLPQNFVTRDELIDWVQEQQPIPGTMLAAVQGLVTTGIVRVTNASPGNAAMDTVAMSAMGASIVNITNIGALRQLEVDYETLTGSGSVNPAKFLTLLASTSGGPYAITIAAGTYIGQLKYLNSPVTTTQNFVLTGALAGIAQIEFGTAGGGVGYTALLQWDGAKWQWLGGNALVT